MHWEISGVGSIVGIKVVVGSVGSIVGCKERMGSVLGFVEGSIVGVVVEWVMVRVHDVINEKTNSVHIGERDNWFIPLVDSSECDRREGHGE